MTTLASTPSPATKADSLPSPASMPPSADPFGSAAKAFAPHSAAGTRQLLNTTKAALEYRIDQVGPSGVGKVEVFMTSDQGGTWQRLTEDADRTSPAEINLPGEGVFGIRLIVTNGNGFGGTLPKKGDAPNSYIEVDTTVPFVQLKDIEPNSKDGCLEIRWKASDKNLGPEPVNLYYRVRHDAAWVPIAKRIRNEGVYMWSFPRDCGNRFFVKIEVTARVTNQFHTSSHQTEDLTWQLTGRHDYIQP